MSKRADNEGTVYFDNNLNRYVGQFRYTEIGTGLRKRKKLYGQTKKEVLAAGQKFMRENEEKLQQQGAITTASFVHNWLQSVVKPAVRVKTFDRYDCTLRRQIQPHIGHIPLQHLSRQNLQDFLNTLKNKGSTEGKPLSARTVNATRRLLKTALDMAVADGMITTNPVDLTKPFKVEHTEMQIFTPEEYSRLLSAAKGYSRNAYLVIRIAFATGFRIGEIFGLEYNAVDPINATLTVRQTVISTNNGKRLQPMAKNANSIRTIKVDDDIINELQKYKEEHFSRKQLLKNKYEQKHDFIIESEFGDFCDPSYFTDKIFKKKLLPAAGLPSTFRMHDCRHTHATWLISRGVNIKAVSQRLGHKSIRTTLDIYSHVTASMQDEAVEALKDVL